MGHSSLIVDMQLRLAYIAIEVLYNVYEYLEAPARELYSGMPVRDEQFHDECCRGTDTPLHWN